MQKRTCVYEGGGLMADKDVHRLMDLSNTLDSFLSTLFGEIFARFDFVRSKNCIPQGFNLAKEVFSKISRGSKRTKLLPCLRRRKG